MNCPYGKALFIASLTMTTAGVLFSSLSDKEYKYLITILQHIEDLTLLGTLS
jgi:hypothetical protein